MNMYCSLSQVIFNKMRRNLPRVLHIWLISMWDWTLHICLSWPRMRDEGDMWLMNNKNGQKNMIRAISLLIRRLFYKEWLCSQSTQLINVNLAEQWCRGRGRDIKFSKRKGHMAVSWGLCPWPFIELPDQFQSPYEVWHLASLNIIDFHLLLSHFSGFNNL